jgi:hypothetical protein
MDMAGEIGRSHPVQFTADRLTAPQDFSQRDGVETTGFSEVPIGRF